MEYTRNSIRDIVAVNEKIVQDLGDKEVRYSECSLASSEVVAIHFHKGG